MRITAGLTALVGILACGFIGVAGAQSSAATSPDEGAATESAVASTPADDTLSGVPDTAQQKKGGGLLGKVKGVAKTKVVQQVAKTAACNMLPGGQIVAGAIDAAANKDAAGAGGQPSGMDPATMAAYNAQMVATMQASMARMGQAGQMSVMPGMAGPGNMAGLPSEAEGRALEVSSDLLDELRKGKSAIRHIDWIAGTPSVSAAGSAAFAEAIGTIAAAMQQVGGSYRLDLYMDKRYDETAVAALGQQRLSTVQVALLNAGGASDPSAMPRIGKIKRDGDPRLEIVKVE